MDIFSWSWLSDGTPYLGLIVWHGSIHFSTKEVDLGDFKFMVLSMEVQTRIAKENNTLVCLISIWYMVKPRGAFVYSIHGLIQWNLDILNEVPRDWQNWFAVMKFRYIEVLFHLFYYFWGKENLSLYRRPRYIEVRYIDVSLYINNAPNKELFSVWLW